MLRIAGLVVATLMLLAPSLWGAGETETISGTILRLDKEAGTIVLGEIGPWRVTGGATEVTTRTIALTSATEFKRVTRAAGAGPTGWVGEFVEVGIGAGALKAGDFVTVQIRRDGSRLTAVKVEQLAASE